METLNLATAILGNLNIAWSFILLIVRFSGFFFTVPGLGEGAKGMLVRAPAIAVLAFASMRSSAYTEIPGDVFMLILQVACEFMFGMFVGLIPLMVVSAVQMACQLASTSMGLGASQLFDPTTGGSVSDLSRICGDLTVILFLVLGGDHVVVKAVSGLGGTIVTGSYIPGEFSVGLMVDRTAHIFLIGILLSSPVIVALLLTQFVLGLITRAVPTVNIFIVSFPLTIGIGLVLTVLALPDMMVLVKRELAGIEGILVTFLQDAKSI